MTVFPMVPLGSVAIITNNRANPFTLSSTTPYIGLEHMKRGGGLESISTIGSLGIKSTVGTFETGSVLFGRLRPNLRKVARVDFSGTCSGDINSLITSEALSTDYLAHFLRSDIAAAQIQRFVTGINLPRINAKSLKKIQVPLPPLDEQRRIADILDRSKDLHNRTTRHASLASTLTSVIPEPIDPAEVSLSHYVSSVSSGRNISEVDNNISGARVLKVSAVTSQYFRPEESKLLPDSYLPPSQHRVMSGDLIVSRANTKDLVGAAALVQSEVNNMYLPDKLWRLNLKDHVDRHFLWCLLGNPAIRSRVGQRASGSSGSMKNISQKNFLSLPVPNFSRPEQEEIGARVRASLEYTEALEKKSEKLDELYNSLATRAFAGEL